MENFRIFLVLFFLAAFSSTNAQLSLSSQILYKNSGTGAGVTTVQDIKNLSGGGTVSSVGLAVPTGLLVSNSPVTGVGVLTVTNNMAAGYVKSAGVNGSLQTVTAIQGADISGNITGSAANVTGIVSPANGGTGATTLSGYLFGNGTSAVTASSTIPTTALSGTIANTQLTNNSININGTATPLGGSRSITLQDATTAGATTTTASTFSGGLVSSGTTSISGGLNYGVGAQITASTTLAATTVIRQINSTTNITVTIPNGLDVGRMIRLPLATTSTGQVIIAPDGSDTFNGVSSFVVFPNSQGATIQLIKLSATEWNVTLL